MSDTGERGERLLPYVPRLAIDWVASDPNLSSRTIDGSMVFVDISGFTKMSERLARRGKIGAEEVTDVMNATFGRLLGVAYEHGGGLVKFGGDALLLFFRDRDHAPRAVAAAAGMRRALREHGRIATSAGSVTLRMSVGVHTGEFAFFLVGRSHHELLVAGPAASRTVEMEQAAEAGEILLSPECAALLPARHRGRAKGPGFLLRGTPAAPEAPAFDEPPRIDLAECVPVAIRAQLLSGIGEPEHRQATIAFIHFDGADEAIASHGADAFAASLGELVEIAQSAADEHGVSFLATDIDRDGGKIILVAGAPQATAEDEERMLRAVRAVVDSGCELPVRAGINKGPIFSGDVGAPYRRTYTVMGDAVNLAARLMARASAGQIIATRGVLDRSRTLFDTHELEPFTVKGKAQPIVAFDVRAIRGTRADSARRLPFVGREDEMALMHNALDAARDGRGAIIDLVGEAGIGKTRLVDELRSEATGFRQLQTASEPYAVSTPYFTFRGLLRELLGVASPGDAAETTALLTDRLAPIAPDLIPWLPLLAVPLDVTVRATAEADAIDPKFRKQRIHESVSSLLGALLPGPALIVFEDAYWMDDASRDLLLDLAARRASSPWLLVLTRRPHTPGFETTGGMPATMIKLEPLGEEAAASLARSAAGEQPVPQSRLAALAERAGGNPLFLQELVAAASEDPSMEALPESIEAVVNARIDLLEPHDRTLLRYASVVGTVFSPALVGEVLESEHIDAGPRAWERLRDFVEVDADGRYRFLHAMFRDVAYEGLPFRRRRLLHRRTGEILERRPNSARLTELLSLHFFRAQIYDKAWTYSRSAGEGAREKYAHVEAAGFYRRALDSARKLASVSAAEQSEVAESLGDVCEMAGLYADAENAYEIARKLTRSDGLDEPHLLLKEGVLRERAGRYSDALRWYARGLRVLRRGGGRTETAARLSLASAGVKVRQGRFADAIRLCKAVVESGAEPAQLAHAYYLLHLAHVSIGSPDRAQYRDLALPIYERLGDLLGQANVLNNLGIDAYYEGRWDEALALYRRSREARERIGDAIGAIQMTNNIGEILSDQGRLEEAGTMFRDVIAVCRASGYRLGIVLGTSNLARVTARAGRAADADDDQRRCFEEILDMNAGEYINDVEMRYVECAVLAGRSQDALTRADAALARVRATSPGGAHEAALQRLVGYAHRQQGRAALAAEAFADALRMATTAGALFEQALAHQALASLGGRADEAAHTRAAKELFERLGVVATPAIP